MAKACTTQISAQPQKHYTTIQLYILYFILMVSAYMYSYNKIAKQYDTCSGATMTHHVTLQTQHMYKLYIKNL